MKTKNKILLIITIVLAIITIFVLFKDNPATYFVAGALSMFVLLYTIKIYKEQTPLIKLPRNKKHQLKNIYTSAITINNLNNISHYYNLKTPTKIIKECLYLLNKYFKNVYILPEKTIIIISEFNTQTVISRKIRYDQQKQFVSFIQNLIENYPFLQTKLCQHIKVTTTIGISSVTFQNQQDTLEDLVKLAIFSQEKAYKNNQPYHIATEETVIQKNDAVSFYNELENGLILYEFTPYYQPILDPKTRKIVGCESLMRWEKNTYRSIEANKFIDIAREKNMIHHLDMHIMNESLKELSKWRKEELIEPSFQMTLNLDINTLHKIKAHELVSLCNRYQISPKQIAIDIGEHDIFHKDVNHLLLQLKEIGFNLSLDTTKSPFKALQILPEGLFNAIKFDTEMIFKSQNNMQNITLFSTLFSLSQKLSLKVNIKGLETKKQLTVLEKLNVARVQGKYISSPLTKNRMHIFLTKYQYSTIR